MLAKFLNQFVFILTWCSALVFGKYEIPDALVEALPSKGFTVSIPDQDGIEVFAFKGMLNAEFEGKNRSFRLHIFSPNNGRWIFKDKSTVLKPGDILTYQTYVNYKMGRHSEDITRYNQSFTFEEGSNCLRTITKVNKNTTCAGKILFEEDFTGYVSNNFTSDKWEKDVIYAGEPDYEFVIYTDDVKNIYILNNTLYIKPSLTDDRYGDGFVSNRQGFDLGKSCTGIPETPECTQKPHAYFILPPVLSARINTRKSFSFIYGVVEIRAKLPKGDWIYPELYLNPKYYEYGAGLESGQIRIAFLPGNQIMSKTLYGGCLLGSSVPARKFAMKSVDSHTNWNDDFHVFTVKWMKESITLLVDNELYGRVYPPIGGFSSKGQDLGLTAAHRWYSIYAPFDAEMYLSIGVGVGGHSFTDGPQKPWVNNDPKGQKVFYNAKDSWYTKWSSESALQVDYIKVTAI